MKFGRCYVNLAEFMLTYVNISCAYVKAQINEQFRQFNRVWKWYDERQNRWVSYAYANNKMIDTAYKNGETSVRIVASRKHYIIHFNTMVQENEETMHKRPVMLSFEKPPTPTSQLPPPPQVTVTAANVATGSSATDGFQQVDNSISQALESITLVSLLGVLFVSDPLCPLYVQTFLFSIGLLIRHCIRGQIR